MRRQSVSKPGNLDVGRLKRCSRKSHERATSSSLSVRLDDRLNALRPLFPLLFFLLLDLRRRQIRQSPIPLLVLEPHSHPSQTTNQFRGLLDVELGKLFADVA